MFGGRDRFLARGKKSNPIANSLNCGIMYTKRNKTIVYKIQGIKFSITQL